MFSSFTVTLVLTASSWASTLNAFVLQRWWRSCWRLQATVPTAHFDPLCPKVSHSVSFTPSFFLTPCPVLDFLLQNPLGGRLWCAATQKTCFIVMTSKVAAVDQDSGGVCVWVHACVHPIPACKSRREGWQTEGERERKWKWVLVQQLPPTSSSLTLSLIFTATNQSEPGHRWRCATALIARTQPCQNHLDG